MNNIITLKRLVLVKRLYLESVDKASRQHNYSDQMLSVINLFLAVETLMGAVILSADQQPDSAIGVKGYVGGKPSPEQVTNFKLGDYHKFEQLYNQVVAIMRFVGSLGEEEKLFKWGSLERLQKARNDAQHGAKAPHPSDLPDLIVIAKDFIERSLRLYFSQWGVSLAEISLADLIQDRVLREYLEHAETALADDKLEVCSLLLRIAFLLARLKRRYDWWKGLQGRVSDDYDRSQEISRDWGIRALNDPETRLLSNMMREVLKLPRLYDNWSLGLDSVERNRLQSYTPRLTKYPDDMLGIPPSDEVIVESWLEDLISGERDQVEPYFQTIPSAENCLWLLDFTIETLFRWEQEQREHFTDIDTKYLLALPKLVNI